MTSGQDSLDYNSYYRKTVIIFKVLGIVFELVLIVMLYSLLIKLGDTKTIDDSTLISKNWKIIDKLISVQQNFYLSIGNSIIISCIFFKTQLLAKIIGLYSAIKDYRKLLKFIGSGILMGGFAFLNVLLMFNFFIYFEDIILLKSISFFDSVVYINLSLIFVQLILFSLTSNVDMITKNLYLSLNRKFKLTLVICRSLLIIVNIILISLLLSFVAKIPDNFHTNCEYYEKIWFNFCLYYGMRYYYKWCSPIIL